MLTWPRKQCDEAHRLTKTLSLDVCLNNSCQARPEVEYLTFIFPRKRQEVIYVSFAS